MKLSQYVKYIFIFLIFSCKKMDVTPTPQPSDKDIFSESQVVVSDGQDLKLNLPSAGKYTLTLFDSSTSQVLSRERFDGIVGNNTKKIYTKTLQSDYLYLVLRDGDNKEIGKTKIILK